MYVRISSSLRNIEDLLFERGIGSRYVAVRHWGHMIGRYWN